MVSPNPFLTSAPVPRALRLHALEPLRGVDWLRRAVRAVARKPFGLASLFATFALVMLLMQAFSWLGTLVMMAALPCLSLGYMMATQSLERGGTVHPMHLVTALRRPHDGRRASLLVLALGYALLMGAVLALSEHLDGGSFEQLMHLLAQPRTTANRAAIEALTSSDALSEGLWMRMGGIALVSIPFWHAPGLIWWGGQGAMQSLFSSAFALWKTKAAFALYLLGFAALVLGAGTILGTFLSLLSMGSMLGAVATTLGLMFTVVFYASLWFSFDDTFGVTQAEATDVVEATRQSDAS